MPVRKADRSFGRNFRSSKSSFNPRRTKTVEASSLRASEATSQDEKIEATRLAQSIDESMGFARYDAGKKRIGWLCNMHSTSVEDEKIPGGRAGVDYYFLEEDGGSFKATVEYDPYFLIAVRRGREAEVEEWCRRKYEGSIKGVIKVEKEDLQMPNHLLGYRRTFLQLTFANIGDLLGARRDILPIAEKNKSSLSAMDTYAEVARLYTSENALRTKILTLYLAPMLDSIFTTIPRIMMHDVMAPPMRVITLLIFGSTMCLTMYELRLIKVRWLLVYRVLRSCLSLQTFELENGTQWRQSMELSF